MLANYIVTDRLRTALEHPDETSVIRVGRRPRYDLDPGGLRDYIWWIQRTVTHIERVPKEDDGELPDMTPASLYEA